ncbi:hypothetical protein PYCC9005_001198 [Savitreella phatthalungensis]
MDLLVTVTDAGEVSVWRLNGQKVWSQTPFAPLPGQPVNASHTSVVECIVWRDNGRSLAVASGDGQVAYLDVVDGRTMRTFARPAPLQDQKPVSIVWSSVASTRGTLSSHKLIDDIRADLPLLSTLQSASAPEDNLYGSRTALVSLFGHSGSKRPAVDNVLIAGRGGGLHTALGSFDVRIPCDNRADQETITVAGLNTALDHVIYTKDSSGIDCELFRLDFMQRDVDARLRVLAHSQEYVALSDYLREAVEAVKEEYELFANTRKQLHDRCLSILFPPPMPLSECLLHLLLSGRLPLGVSFPKELNLGSLTKWRKTGESALQAIRRIAFESCLPAIERIMIVLNDMQKLAAASALVDADLTASATVEYTQFIVRLHDLMQTTGQELKDFPVFCEWLQYVVERNDPDDDHANDVQTADTLLVLQHVTESIPDCRLQKYFDNAAAQSAKPPESRLITVSATLRQDSEVWRLSVGNALDTIRQLGLHALDPVRPTIESSFSRRSDAQRLVAGDDWQLCRYTADGVEAFALWRGVELVVGAIEPEACQIATLPLRIQHEDIGQSLILAQWIDHSHLLLVLQSADDAKAYSLSQIEVPGNDTFLVSADPSASVAEHRTPVVVSVSRSRELETLARPAGLAVNGRKGRRTCCVLYGDRQRLLTFDLDEEEESETDETSRGDQADVMSE